MQLQLRKMQNPEDLHLPLCGADSHAHLADESLFGDFDGVRERARKAGVAHIGNVFSDIASWRKTGEKFAGAAEIFFILGRHPNDAAMWNESELDEIGAILDAEPRFRAIGEIGLDFYWKDVPSEKQKSVFLAQAAYARERDMPIVIHCRDAVPETLAILEGLGMRDRPLLWHCFGGDARLARRIVRNGWDISIGGPVTYPANWALREALHVIPPDRLQVETDCPYLSPQNRRGKRNEPANAAFTAAFIADCLEVDRAVFWRRCGENTCRFFSL